MIDLDTVIKNKNKLKYSFSINPSKEIIIDFYNIYCNFINFDKYNLFTKESFEKCLNIVLKSSFNQHFFIVSKPIFEVEDSIIQNYTVLYKNLVYIVVEDAHETKSLNKERDDFVCLMINFLKKNSFIISNDKFLNYKNILSNIKSFTLKVFFNGSISMVTYTKEQIIKMTEEMINFKFKRKSFKFIK